MSPTISFVVPCYKLAHLLPECVSSILAQTYGDFEILTLDDCSPDDTPQVAAAFVDPRVRYVRNERNLGHLRNYNKGIALSRGRYVWLISADDRLRTPDLAARYVRIMDENPSVGYVCCSGVRLEKGMETGVEGRLSGKDTIFSGRTFLSKRLKGNFIVAASGMVRRSCYETCGVFPLDLPYAGDWFLWCLFALHYDVAYCAEPMVNYRSHQLSMTNYLMTHRRALALQEGFVILRRIREEAERIGDLQVVKECSHRLGRLYGMHLAGWDCGAQRYCMSEAELDASLAGLKLVAGEEGRMRAKIWTAAGDFSLKQQRLAAAAEYYDRALRYDRQMSTQARRLLVRTGNVGVGFVMKLLWLGRALRPLRSWGGSGARRYRVGTGFD